MFFFCFCLDNSSSLEFQACAPITGWWLLFLFVCFLISLWLFFSGRGGGGQIISKSGIQIRLFDLMNFIEIIIFNSENPLMQQNLIVYQEMRPSVLCLITNILLWIVESQARKKSQKPFCKTPLSNNSCDGFPFYFSVSTQNS